jgi:hypothetical protein
VAAYGHPDAKKDNDLNRTCFETFGIGEGFCKNKLYRHNMLFWDMGSIVLLDVYKLKKNSFVCLVKYMKMKNKKNMPNIV